MKDVYATVIVNLNPKLEDIFKKLQKDARWGIKKAEKEGLKVEITDSERDWKEFYRIYKKTMGDAGIRTETLEHLKKHGKVFFVCKKTGKVIAGATLDIVNNTPYLSRNASLKEFQKLQPNNLLYWNCIAWSKKNGYNKMDLGGWQLNPLPHEKGVNKFKERWGRVIFYKKNFPVKIAIKRKLARNLKFLRSLRGKLKR